MFSQNSYVLYAWLMPDCATGQLKRRAGTACRFRTAHLTQPAAGQVGLVAEDVTEEEEVAETSAELETESDTDDVSDISHPEDLVAVPAENV